MSDESAQPVGFPCKRAGCDEVVEYVPAVVTGALKRTDVSPGRPRTVYLRCPAGHVHPYAVGAE
jgi:hypothetical protein